MFPAIGGDRAAARVAVSAQGCCQKSLCPRRIELGHGGVAARDVGIKIRGGILNMPLVSALLARLVHSFPAGSTRPLGLTPSGEQRSASTARGHRLSMHILRQASLVSFR